MNTPEREETIFSAAVLLPTAARAGYLEQVCGGDVELRQRVQELLEVHETESGFMAEPAAPAVTRKEFGVTHRPEQPGDRIGRYKLLQQIGEGGCGVVYMAEQEEPVRRRVALKVIKLGMDTRDVVAQGPWSARWNYDHQTH